MLLLVVGAKDDLAEALKDLSIDGASLMSISPEGFEAEFADDLETAQALIRESAELLRPVDLALIDGADALETAASLKQSHPAIALAIVAPEDCVEASPVALTVKRPFMKGELDFAIRALAELCGAKRSFDGLFNSASSMMAIVSPSGQVAAWNSAAAEGTGTSSKDALGEYVWEMMSFLKGHETAFSRCFETGEREKLNRLLVEQPGAETKYYDVQISPMLSARGAVVRVDDVTSDVKKDEHLRQAQKMDSVGSLAAGLAHDFNNVIGGIDATMSSIRFSLDNDPNAETLRPALSNDFELVDESVKRGKDIIEQLMALSRRKEQPLSSADLNKMLSDVASICKNTFPRGIVVEVAPWKEGPATVKAFPTQIEQSFLNICINACHAMTIMRKEGESQNGTLSVSITKIEVGTNITSVMPEASEGEYWLVSFTDTGVGMTREVIQRIFEPFFTTKDKGKGTGLGLAMVYNIIRQHKGFMDLFSEPGIGSTFMVFLPVQKES